MELDRHLIERHDFGQARRGYDPEEVDRHLAEVADAVEELRHSRFGQAGPPSLATEAAEQVRTIVDAAERSAAEIETTARTEAERVTAEAKRQAESERSSAAAEAEQMRSDAASDARQTRERAESDARAHLETVQQATSAMTTRADTVETDLSGLVDELRTTITSLVESVRTNAGSLETELVEIKGELAVVRDAGAQAQGAGETAAGDVPVSEAALDDEPTEAATVIPSDDEDAAESADVYVDEELEEAELEEPEEAEELDALEDEPEADEAPDADDDRPAAGGEGAEGARLIALNMALNGTPRDETSRYLEENFDLDDREAILEEVYARVGG